MKTPDNTGKYHREMGGNLMFMVVSLWRVVGMLGNFFVMSIGKDNLPESYENDNAFRRHFPAVTIQTLNFQPIFL